MVDNTEDKQIQEKIKTPVTVIGEDYCPFCQNAKKYFGEDNKDKVEFTWIDSGDNPQARNDAKNKYGWKTIPIVFVNGEFTGGYSETLAKIKNGSVVI